jgi:AcrR family transcriptional regulator
MTDVRRPGRPRSEKARRAILTSSLAELRRRGYADLTIEGIAARAGVGKQTIYRWWSSKAEVVLEAVLDRAESTIAVPDEGSLPADLTRFLTATFRQHGQRPILVALMAQSVLDPSFAKAFRERFLFSRRATLRGIFERAADRGEIDGGIDLEFLVDVVYGVLWYRLLVDHAPLDDDAARQLADHVVRSVPVPRAPSRRTRS